MNYTKEQSVGVNYKGHALAIKSGAGTGKTTLLKGYALANPSFRILYLCYNEATQKEAEGKFPKANVRCQTIHSIAFAICGKALVHKLTNNLRLTDIKKFLNTHSWELTKDANTAFNNFLSSSDKEINLKNASFLPSKSRNQKSRIDLVLKSARKIWEAAKDPDNKFPATHDVYLKIYCLRDADLHRWFGAILFDEAQDANPVVSDLVYRQKCRQIVVGDDHQQLYRWRGADNSIDDFIKEKDADVLIINKSFRFGPNVAKLATSILDYKSTIAGCPPFPIFGNEEISDIVYESLPSKMLNSHYTKLHRTVSGTIKTALDNINKKIFWVGGIEGYNFQEILDVYHFSKNKKELIKRKKLTFEFKNFTEYKFASKSTSDPEMNRIVKLIESHKESLPIKINKLRKNEVKIESEADLTVSTAHRSKGLEWDVVVIDDDFRDFLNPEVLMDKETIADELNLLYVASTRPMKFLQPNALIISILKLMKSGKTPSYIKRFTRDEYPLVRGTYKETTKRQVIRLGD